MTSVENRRRAAREVISERFGSLRAFARASGMSVSRVSRALDQEQATDRRLSPIERALERLTVARARRHDYMVIPAEGTFEAQTEKLMQMSEDGWRLVAAMDGLLYLERPAQQRRDDRPADLMGIPITTVQDLMDEFATQEKK